MNEEESRRVSLAAEAVLRATDSLEEARTALRDERWDSGQERDRQQAAGTAAGRLEKAAGKIEEALRRGAVAAAVSGRNGAYPRYRGAATALREGRAAARSSREQDGTQARRARAEEALEQLEAALTTAAALALGD